MLKGLLSKIRKAYLYELVIVIVALSIVTAAYTNFVLFSHPNSEIFTKGIADSAGGFTWLVYADKDWNPAWAHTTLINYPYGQDLSSPFYMTWLLVFGPMWLLAKFFSPILSLNLMTVLGYVTSGLAMYILIKRLTRRRDISFFAAFATAFTPYHIINSSDHITVLYNWVFVAIIAAFLAFWRRPTAKRGALLAVCIAASFYTDGYFILVGSVLVLSLVVAAIIVDLMLGKGVRRTLGVILRLARVAVIVFLLVSPLVVTQLTAGKQIAEGLSNARDDIRGEVAFYASRPLDFLLPAEGNVLVGKYSTYLRLLQKKDGHSNYQENSTYVGFVLLALFTFGVGYSARLLLRNKRNSSSLSLWQHGLLIAVVAAPLVLIWMLPPALALGGTEVEMPIGVLIHFVSFWRVPSRIFVALQPLIVVAASLALYAVLRTKRLLTRTTTVGVFLLIVVLGLEFTTTVNRPSFGFKDMPRTYTWLAGENDIHSIEEVPIVDRPIEVSDYYLFGQMMHNKPLTNASLASTPIGLLNPLGDETNPETINFAKARGVDAVIIHSDGCKQESWGRLVHTESGTLPPPYMGKQKTSTCVYILNDKTPTDDYFLFAKKGFAKTDYLDSQGHLWLALNDNQAELTPVNNKGNALMMNGKANFTAKVSFIAGYHPKKIGWTVIQDGQSIANGEGEGTSAITANVALNKPVQIVVTVGDMNITPAPGEVGLRTVQLTKQ